MTISFRASSAQAAANATALTVNKPTGTASGDFMLAHIFSNNTSLPTTVPSGWTLEDSFNNGGVLQMIYSHTAGGSEGASYEWDWAVATIHAGVITSLQSNASAAMTVNILDKQANTSSATTTFKAVTTTAANTFLLFMAQIGANATRAPDGGEDERYDTGATLHQYCMTTPFVGPGDTGVHTCTGASAAVARAYTVAVAEISGGFSASDSAIVSDTPSLLIPTLYITAADSTSVTDTPALFSSTYFVQASDSVSVTSTPALFSPTLSIQATQAVTVTATPTLVGPPSKPTGLTATAITGSRVDLAWTHDGINTDGYSIERSTSEFSGFVEIDTTTDKFYSDTGLTANTTYYYRIRAFDA